MKKKVLTVLLSLTLLLGFNSPPTTASIESTQKLTKNNLHVVDNESIHLANKIIKYDKNNELDCTSPYDLVETCYIIKELVKYTKFDQYDVAAIMFDESKLNKDAHNKKDGGIGLMQLTGIKKWHKDTLFWVTNPRDKHQNIIGSLIILEEIRREHKTKPLIYKHYNGSNKKAERYSRRIQKIKREMKAC